MNNEQIKNKFIILNNKNYKIQTTNDEKKFILLNEEEKIEISENKLEYLIFIKRINLISIKISNQCLSSIKKSNNKNIFMFFHKKIKRWNLSESKQKEFYNLFYSLYQKSNNEIFDIITLTSDLEKLFIFNNWNYDYFNISAYIKSIIKLNSSVIKSLYLISYFYEEEENFFNGNFKIEKKIKEFFETININKENLDYTDYIEKIMLKINLINEEEKEEEMKIFNENIKKNEDIIEIYNFLLFDSTYKKF